MVSQQVHPKHLHGLGLESSWGSAVTPSPPLLPAPSCMARDPMCMNVDTPACTSKSVHTTALHKGWEHWLDGKRPVQAQCHLGGNCKVLTVQQGLGGLGSGSAGHVPWA